MPCEDVETQMVQSEILYVHAKRSTRIDPGHWLFDTGTRATIGSLNPRPTGWQINLYDGREHPSFPSLEALCTYISEQKGKPVRKASVRELPLPEDL
jgi:hypothetical protein